MLSLHQKLVRVLLPGRLACLMTVELTELSSAQKHLAWIQVSDLYQFQIRKDCNKENTLRLRRPNAADLLQLVQTLQQTCQFHQVVRSMLMSGLL